METKQEATTDTATPQVPAKPATPEKLSSEEENKRLLFIGRCVDRDICLPANNRFGVTTKLTVQQLSNSSVDTLQGIGRSITVAIAGHDPEFSDSEVLKVGGIAAQDWVDFIRLNIRRAKWRAFAAKQRSLISSLKADIAAAETPEERRLKAEAQLAQLTGDFKEEE